MGDWEAWEMWRSGRDNERTENGMEAGCVWVG